MSAKGSEVLGDAGLEMFPGKVIRSDQIAQPIRGPKTVTSIDSAGEFAALATGAELSIGINGLWANYAPGLTSRNVSSSVTQVFGHADMALNPEEPCYSTYALAALRLR